MRANVTGLRSDETKMRCFGFAGGPGTRGLWFGMIQGRQIEAFRAVMLTGTMTAAAAAIHVTQPAVSRLVRDLENGLGLVLFRRRGNLVVATEQAHALLAEVERSFVGLQRIEDFAADLREGRGGLLNVAALPAMTAGFMPRFVARFGLERPQLRIRIDGLPSRTVRENVVAGLVEVGVTLVPFTPMALSLTILEDTAVVVLPETHRLAGQRSVRAEDLHDESLILLTKFMHGRHPIERVLQSIRRGRVLETPLSTIACAMVAEGAGVTIVDPFCASEFVGKGVVVRPFEPSLLMGTAVVHSSERPLSIVAEEFRSAFVAHAQDFLRRADYVRF